MRKAEHCFSFILVTLAGAVVVAVLAGTAQARPQPDLIVNISIPAVAMAGADIGAQIRLTVKNIGTAPAWGTTGHATGYMVDLTLGRDQAVPPGFATFSPNYAEDVLLKGGRVSVTTDLAPREARRYAAGAGIPNDTPEDNYFLCASVDPGTAVAELNEANNTTCRRIKIAAPKLVGPQDDLPGAFKRDRKRDISPQPPQQVPQSSLPPVDRKPFPPPQPDCRNALGGTITRSVGNLQHGPPRPAGLPNIQVQLLDTRWDRIAQTRTDRDGRYAFREVCPGTYTVCPGTPCPTRDPIPSRYSPSTREVTVPPRLQNGIDFHLMEPPPVPQDDPIPARQP